MDLSNAITYWPRLERLRLEGFDIAESIILAHDGLKRHGICHAKGLFAPVILCTALE